MRAENNIFEDVKHAVIGTDEDSYYDDDIKRNINTAFMIAFQAGIGPTDKPFKLTDCSETWDDFVDEREDVDGVKDYIINRVKIFFDPSTNSTLLQAQKDLNEELEWRLSATFDLGLFDKEETE